MAAVNTQIVRRSNALQGWAYGRSLQYGEVMGEPADRQERSSPGQWTGLRASTGAMAFPPTRVVLDPAVFRHQVRVRAPARSARAGSTPR